jgi:probable rRNA maturation factor
MIYLRNTQRSIKINTAQLKKDVQTFLTALGYEDFDIGIWITTDATIQKYNREYRQKDKPTDILSFPYHPPASFLDDSGVINPAAFFKNAPRQSSFGTSAEEDAQLGDLIISAAYVKKDAARLGISFERRMRRLLVHGICHLLGYDHMKDSEYKVMLAKERQLLEAAFGKKEAAEILVGE